MRMNKEEAWEFALGLIKVDGLEPSEEFLEMVKKEINNETTLSDIEMFLHEKYGIKKRVSENKNYILGEIKIADFEAKGFTADRYSMKGD